METVASREGHDRIAYLDGLRGIAISLVVLFHAYSGWPKLVPYGDRFASFPPFAYGKFGVQLFFLISGFVIFMTLERCASIKEFAWRRWIRLFPAMFVCSLLVWLTSNWFPERPAGPATASQLIPGLTFIDPVWFQSLGLRLPAIEGAYWTIFVEAQFYLVAGVTYFLLGRQRALAIVLGLFFLAAIVALGRMIGFPVPPLAAAVMKHLSAIYFGWFAAGALFYFYYAERSPRLLVAALTVALLAVCTTKSPVAIVIPALFMAPLFSPTLKRALSHRALLFMGFISYPLYLCHENLMVALIIKLGRLAPTVPHPLLAVIPIAYVIVLAWVVARVLEPATRLALVNLVSDFTQMSGSVGARERIEQAS